MENNNFIYYSDFVPQERCGIKKRNEKLIKRLISAKDKRDIIAELALNNKALIWFVLEAKFRISEKNYGIDREELFNEVFIGFYEELEKGINHLIDKKELDNLCRYGFWSTFVYRRIFVSVRKMLKIWETESKLLYIDEENMDFPEEPTLDGNSIDELISNIVDADFRCRVAEVYESTPNYVTTLDIAKIDQIFYSENTIRECTRAVLEELVLRDYDFSSFSYVELSKLERLKRRLAKTTAKDLFI